MMIDNQKEDKHLVKHLVIRLLILFIPAILLLAIFASAESDYALFFVFAAYLSPIIGFVFLIAEAIVLNNRKKIDLRNINLIIIVVFLLIYIIILANHP